MQPKAILFDRDGTLIYDLPRSAGPSDVVLMPGIALALARVRAAGIRTAVVSNQCGVGEGTLDIRRMHAINRRIDELAGPMDGWFVCLHATHANCSCRKPRPGLIHRAAKTLGVEARDCVVIGDIGSDMEAARAAGARAIMIPNESTLAHEIVAAPEVAFDMLEAVEWLVDVAYV
ncbi:MAG: HAD-IIIA family hydrolase [Candidatus Eremiobacteraeota bacterium]|nr:HAD-IIIA family hydrolase [Candidatus Eremiobacteraeota bacterium]